MTTDETTQSLQDAIEQENLFLEANAGQRLASGIWVPVGYKPYRRTVTGDDVDVKRLNDPLYFKQVYESVFARGYATDEKLYQTLRKILVPAGREASGYLADLYKKSKQ